MIRCFKDGSVRLSFLALLGLFLSVATIGHAEERGFQIVAPATVEAGQAVDVTITASTNAAGEQVGFLQVEVSTDGGESWSAVCYLQSCGPRVEQRASIKSGATGTTLKLRARAAFRDGLAGDVDYRGAAIFWQQSWNNWESPPAKFVSIAVRSN